jgi:putative ABC transport system permease protein
VRPSRFSLFRGVRLHLDATGLLAVIGVAIGAANIIALISVTDTARQQTFRVLREVGANTLFILPFVEEGDVTFQRANAGAFMPQSYMDTVAKLPDIDLVAGVLMLPGHVGAGANRRFATIEGASPGYPDIRNHHPVRGRYSDAAEETARARVCVLGANLPQALFGDADPLGQSLVIKGERFTVIGIMQKKGMVGFENMDERVFIPLATAQQIYDIPGVHSLMARVRHGVPLVAAKRQVEAALRQVAHLAPGEPADFSVSSVDELTGILDNTLSIFRWLMIGVSSVALLVAGTGIMNVMLMQVIARTREIGVRRAVGARRRDILWQFIAEALAQTLAGAALGIVLGIAGSVGFCLLVKWQPYITPLTVLLAGGFSLSVGLLFGVYPAMKAALLKPIDCLRYE